ncbi:MAG TPA: SGNH/GDSL hydrolase family protein [Streptosporangiaceae bacterium]|nr:SGNH/GDSL hydrolase family protein [Streptosporangiaceae bacterium]
MAAAVGMTVPACSSPAHTGPASYYLALGDSLSQGVQPNAAGTSVETSQGYPDLVYASLERTHPSLKLVRLGCPGETTGSMQHGGICHYQTGSQLAAAIAFLHAHRGHLLLVTIDIGANDPESCGAQSNLAATVTCIGAIPSAATKLTAILTALRAAAGSNVRIVGMSYYLPALAEWRHGMLGRVTAYASERLAASYNNLLGNAYAKANIAVANVFGAFDTTNFGDQQDVPGVGMVPKNVALICKWTWECTAPPRGPNQHANPAGYQVMATAILKAANLS